MDVPVSPLWILGLLVIAVPIFIVSYRAGRVTKHRGEWKPFTQGSSASPPANISTSVVIPVRKAPMILGVTGSLLLFVGCFLPATLLEQSAVVVGPPMGKVIFGTCALVAGLLAASGRFRSLGLPAGISLAVLIGDLWVNSMMQAKYASEPEASKMVGKVFGIGPAWWVYVAGTVLILLSAALGGASSHARDYRVPPRH